MAGCAKWRRPPAPRCGRRAAAALRLWRGCCRRCPRSGGRTRSRAQPDDGTGGAACGRVCLHAPGGASVIQGCNMPVRPRRRGGQQAGQRRAGQRRVGRRTNQPVVQQPVGPVKQAVIDLRTDQKLPCRLRRRRQAAWTERDSAPLEQPPYTRAKPSPRVSWGVIFHSGWPVLPAGGRCQDSQPTRSIGGRSRKWPTHTSTKHSFHSAALGRGCLFLRNRRWAEGGQSRRRHWSFWRRARAGQHKCHGDSRRRDCHHAAPPSTFSRCFNRDKKGGVIKMTVSPTATWGPHSILWAASRSLRPTIA